MRYYTGSLFAWVCRRYGYLGLGILVIFMTMTSLAGFWEEKRLEYIISSLTNFVLGGEVVLLVKKTTLGSTSMHEQLVNWLASRRQTPIRILGIINEVVLFVCGV